MLVRIIPTIMTIIDIRTADIIVHIDTSSVFNQTMNEAIKAITQ